MASRWWFRSERQAKRLCHFQIVGWYKFRRNSTMRPTLREKMVHDCLQYSLGPNDPEKFVFGLFTASKTSNVSTHSFDHVFLHCQDKWVFQAPSKFAFQKHLSVQSHHENKNMPATWTSEIFLSTGSFICCEWLSQTWAKQPTKNTGFIQTWTLTWMPQTASLTPWWFMRQ